MTTKILKATTKGQITLPKQWRSKYQTDNYRARISSDKIIIEPLEDEQWETVWDADRDNNGESVSVEEIISVLKSAARGQDK